MSANQLEVLALPDVSAEDQEGSEALAAAQAMDVVDVPTFTKASEMLVGVAKLRKRIEGHFAPVIEASHKAHKSALATRDQHTKPLAEIEGVLRGKVGNYQAIERARVEAERRAEEERQRKEFERIRAEQEAARRIEEGRRLVEAARLEEVARAEAAKAREAQNEAARKAAEAASQRAMAAAAAVVEAPIVPAYVPKQEPRVAVREAPIAKGVSFTERWRAEVTGKSAFVAWCLAQGRLDILDVKQSAIDKLAKDAAGKGSVPGLNFISETGTTVRT